jgi:hypothetical protein
MMHIILDDGYVPVSVNMQEIMDDESYSVFKSSRGKENISGTIFATKLPEMPSPLTEGNAYHN